MARGELVSDAILLGMLAIWEIYRACLERYDALRNFATLIFLAGTAVLLAVAIGLALYVSRLITRPLARVNEVLGAVADGDLTVLHGLGGVRAD